MGYNQVGGTINSLAFATNQLNQLFSVPNNAVLSHFRIDGLINSAPASGAYATTTIAEDPIVGGIQFGNSGYGGTALTTASPAGASWVSWANLPTGYPELILVPGLSPQNCVLGIQRMMTSEFRCSFRFANASDIYLAVGTFPGQTFNFGINARWWAEYAS